MKPKLRKVSLLFSDEYHTIKFVEVMTEITITQNSNGTFLSMPQHQAAMFEKQIQENQRKTPTLDPRLDQHGLHLVQVLAAYKDGMSPLPSIYNVELTEQREGA